MSMYNKTQQIISAILLVPPIISVFVFTTCLAFPNVILQTAFLGDTLTGKFYNGGYATGAPIYLGLMAIAGAIVYPKKQNQP